MTQFRIGALRDLYHQLLYDMFQSSVSTEEKIPSRAELLFDTAPAHIERLMNNELDAAFINPIDFALNSSDLVVYPAVCAATSGMSDIVRLYLREKIKTISSLAVNTTSASEVVLARIVLTEKYEAAPSIVPVAGDIPSMLKTSDSALTVGDDVLKTKWNGPFIDVVDEWTDITELPFVHTLCVSRNDKFIPELNALLAESLAQGKNNVTKVALSASAKIGIAADDLLDYYSSISYTFNEELHAGLDEFFRMAFYQGMLSDIPEVSFGE
ncbi:MAG: hypothetical protein PHP42_00385 [Bacteroidota bacterium]|nr:hypothetical protein [Bacteroidota bacterium]